MQKTCSSYNLLHLDAPILTFPHRGKELFLYYFTARFWGTFSILFYRKILCNFFYIILPQDFGEFFYVILLQDFGELFYVILLQDFRELFLYYFTARFWGTFLCYFAARFWGTFSILFYRKILGNFIMTETADCNSP